LTIFGDSRNRFSLVRVRAFQVPPGNSRYPQNPPRYPQVPADHKIVIAPPKTKAKHEAKAKAKAIEAKSRRAESEIPRKINGEEN
jgi:hypothetical protein